MSLRLGVSCYWRFKGEKAYRYGYPTMLKNGLVRMGAWNGDTVGGVVVDPKEIEVR